MSAHTPGPWSVEYDADGKLHVTAGEHLDLAEVGVCQGGDPEADARVMASAPELLAALKRIAEPDSCGCMPCHGDCVSSDARDIQIAEIRSLARYAIARATGDKV